MLFELWVSVALLGLWSCVGVIYRNSRRASQQMDDVVRLLADIAARTETIADTSGNDEGCLHSEPDVAPRDSPAPLTDRGLIPQRSANTYAGRVGAAHCQP